MHQFIRRNKTSLIWFKRVAFKKKCPDNDLSEHRDNVFHTTLIELKFNMFLTKKQVYSNIFFIFLNFNGWRIKHLSHSPVQTRRIHVPN